MQSYSTAKSVS